MAHLFPVAFVHTHLETKKNKQKQTKHLSTGACFHIKAGGT